MQRRILIVDDEPRIRSLVGVVLQGAGYQTEEAEGGAEALDRIRTSPPDLCVLDIMMPRVDGLEVLRTVREHPDTADLPVVLLTAKGQPRDRLAGWEIGCDAYVPKPFEPQDVVQEVAAVLMRDPAERRALRERQMTVVRSMLEKGRRNGGRRAG